MKINNVPDYAKKHPYWVIRDCGKDGKWFFGAFPTSKKAVEVSKTIGNGTIFINKP